MIFALLLFWLILSGKITIYFLIACLVSLVLVALIDRKLFISSPLFLGFKWSWLVFFTSLLRDMFISAFQVLKLVWFPSSINPHSEWVDMKIDGDIKKSIYANYITLTPGTMTMDIEENRILVHALKQENISELKTQTLENHILRLL
ncbi:MAG: Na+/H+ antiporter subunit E [Pseudomonadota bacterium]